MYWKNVCVCFEELSGYDPTFTNLEEYAVNTKRQLSQFTYIIYLHQKKEELILTNDICYLEAHKIRTAIYYTDITRIHFLDWIENYGDCGVILPTKRVRVSQILSTLESLLHAWDLSLTLYYHPNTKMTIKSLKNILDTHYELIVLAEKYCSMKSRQRFFAHNPTVNFETLNNIFY